MQSGAENSGRFRQHGHDGVEGEGGEGGETLLQMSKFSVE